MARTIYHAASACDREAKKKHLAKILSVTVQTIREGLSRIDKDSKEARDKKIFDLWLACYTQEEIAEQCDCSQPEVAKSIPNEDIFVWNNNAEPTAKPWSHVLVIATGSGIFTGTGFKEFRQFFQNS